MICTLFIKPLQSREMCKKRKITTFYTVCKHIRVFALLYKSSTYEGWHDSSMIYSVSSKKSGFTFNQSTVFQGVFQMSNAIQFSELLKQAVSVPGILSSAYSAFHNYSIGNQMAAMTQCIQRGIDPAPINTFKGWQQLGRNVSKGQKAIALCMPVSFKVEVENKQTGQTDQQQRSAFVWKNNWFVLSQTEGQDFANEVQTPDWSADLALSALDIQQIPFSELNGNCQGYATGQSIAINPVALYPHKTRFHELAHVVLGHTVEHTMTDSETTPRDIREVEAESVAYILCSILGLPGLDESRGYIQGWLSGADVTEKSAKKIFSTANKILNAGKPTA